MEKQTIDIELSAKELYAIAQITGTLLGYAVSDSFCERELVSSIFNRANEKLSELLISTSLGQRGIINCPIRK